MSSLLMLVAYRTTGKDTFYTVMKESGDWSKLGYEAYVNPTLSLSETDKLAQVLRRRPTGGRISCADILKEEIFGELLELGDPGVARLKTWQDLDAVKEEKRFGKDGKESSFRDLCIERARLRLAQNPHYWCQQVVNTVPDSPKHWIHTDYRRPAELEYWTTCGRFASIVTARLFRAAVPIPAETTGLEHDLDSSVTDVLLVKPDDCKAAIAQFPQYANFKKLLLQPADIPLGSKRTRSRIGASPPPVPASPSSVPASPSSVPASPSSSIDGSNKRRRGSDTNGSSDCFIVYLQRPGITDADPSTELIGAFDTKDEALRVATSYTDKASPLMYNNDTVLQAPISAESARTLNVDSTRLVVVEAAHVSVPSATAHHQSST